MCEEEDVGEQEQHPPEGVDRIEQAHREQAECEVEAGSEVLSHADDECSLAHLTILRYVSVVIDDKDIHTR